MSKRSCSPNVLQGSYKEPVTIHANLKVIFSVDDALFEPGLLEFVTGFSVILSYGDVAELDDRIELLREAIPTIEAAIPTGPTCGTTMGAVLTTWPRGRKLVGDAKNHLTTSMLTRSGIARFSEKLQSFSSAAQRLVAKGGLLLAGPGDCADARSALVALKASMQSDLKETLPEFCPSIEGDELVGIMSKWKTLLGEAWSSVGGGLPEPGRPSEVGAVAARLLERQGLALLLHAGGRAEQGHLDQRRHVADDRAHEALGSVVGVVLVALEGRDGGHVGDLHEVAEGGRQYLQALPVEFSGWGASDIEALSSSPLLDPATGVMSKILEVTRKDRASGCGGGGGVREHIPDRTASRCAITPSFAKVSSHCKCSFWATGLAAFDCYFSSFVLSIHVGLCRTATSS